MSELPPPGPDAVPLSDSIVPDEGFSGPDPFGSRAARAGDLTPGWRILVTAAWIMVFFAYAAVWKASDEIGIGTWWLGSRSQPTAIPVRLIPFAMAFTVALLAAYNVRRLPWVGLGAAIALTMMATFDFSWSIGLAMVELGVAAGALLTALGSFTGTYRLKPAAAPGSEEAVNG